MFDEGKVGVFEMICLMTITITAKIFFLSISQISELSGTSAWLQTIITGLTMLLIFFIIYKLMERFEGNNLLEIYDIVFGSIIAKIIFLSLVIYFIVYIAFILREFVDILKSISLPLTPISLTLISFILAMILICNKGFESLTRIASFFSLLLIIMFFSIIFIPVYAFNIHRLFPILGYGLDKTIINGITYTSSYAELIALPIFIKSFQGIKNFKKIGYWTIILSSLTFFIATFSYVLIMPYNVAPTNIAGLYTLARGISYGRFLQRFEALYIIAWVLSSLINLGFGLYFLSFVFAKTYKLPDYKPLIIPFSILIYTVAILPQNFSWISQIGIRFIRTYSVIPAFGLILLALILSLIRNKKGAMNNV